MELRAENVEKLNVGDYPGARLCKGLLLDAIEAGDKLEARVKELLTENERLKKKLEQTEANNELQGKSLEVHSELITKFRKENARLKCLALHAMSEWLSALLWLAGTDLGECLVPHIDVNLCTALRRKYEEAYRKAKKELKEKIK